jgi:multidrug efflux pump subunit AcrA (membrane-fusion protein)
MAERGAAGLFREEVIQEQARKLEGTVLFAQPVAARIAAPALIACTLAGVAFLALAKYARTEKVPGYVAPRGGVRTVLPARPGVVSAVRPRWGTACAKANCSG